MIRSKRFVRRRPTLVSRRRPLQIIHQSIVADYVVAELSNFVPWVSTSNPTRDDVLKWLEQRLGPSYIEQASKEEVIQNRIERGFSLKRAMNYNAFTSNRRYYKIKPNGTWAVVVDYSDEGQFRTHLAGLAFRHHRDAIEFKLTWSDQLTNQPE